MNLFDFDGVVSIGIHPGPNDVIVTGRGYDEAEFVYDQLARLGARPCAVYFNPKTKFSGRTREQSGQHKAGIIVHLATHGGYQIETMFEDDDVQITEIENYLELFLSMASSSVLERLKGFRICKINSDWVAK